MSVFQHAIFVLQDLNGGDSWNKWTDSAIEYDPSILLQNFEIYIGDDPIYYKNQKCAGGPFLRVDDPSSYYYDLYAAAYSGGT